MLLQVGVYSVQWVLIINFLWLFYLSAHAPDRFHAIMTACGGGRNRHAKRGISQWRASAHLFAGVTAIIGATYFLYQGALGFVPYSWGRVDEYGEFHAVRDTLSVVFALGTAYLMVQVVTVAGERGLREDAAKSAASLHKDEQAQAAKAYSALSDRLLRLERSSVSKDEKCAENLRVLRNELARLRGLIPPDVLENDDRNEAEKANAPPRVYRS